MGDWFTSAEGASSAGSAASSMPTAASSFTDYINAAQTGPTEAAASNIGTVTDAYTPSYMGMNSPTAVQAQPGFFDNGGALDTFLKDYDAGRKGNMVDAWQNKGMNARTAGYIGNKVEGLMGMAPGAGQAHPASITVNQNNQDPWATIYARYYRR